MRVVQLTVEAALRAREAVIHEEAATEGAKTNILVAGSLPPLAASFRADLVGLPEALEPEYEHIATALAPHVDLFLIETMSKVSAPLIAAEPTEHQVPFDTFNHDLTSEPQTHPEHF